MNTIPKPLTKSDILKVRNSLAVYFPAERPVQKFWQSCLQDMGTVSLSETIQGIKTVLFLVKTAQTILVDEVGMRGAESTFAGISSLDEIKKEATELLEMLEG